MGLYSTALFVGAALASGLTVPLLPLLGGSWRAALAIWALPALLACFLWLPQMFRAGSSKTARLPDASATTISGPPSASPSLMRAMFKDRIALAVTAFMGIQSTSYYIALTWVPTMLQDAGMDATSAGWMLSFSAFPGVVGALLTPSLAKRFRSPRVPVLVSIALPTAAYLGLAFAPLSATYLWMTLLGLGQGVAISLALSYIVWRSANALMTGQLSTMAQGTGYLFAAIGPIGIGTLYAVTGGWAVPFLAMGLLLVLQLLAGLVASKERYVLGGVHQDIAV